MGKINRDQKRLPKVYRLKKKAGKIKKPELTESPTTTIIIRNISFKANEEDIRKLFSPFGEIVEINLPKRSNGLLTGRGTIKFKNEEDASKAIFQNNKIEFLGRKLLCRWTVSKSKNINSKKPKLEENKEKSIKKRNNTINLEDINHTEKPKKEEIRKKNVIKKLTLEERKAQKLLKQKKRGRIIVRNLPFKASEEDIQQFFSEYGNIDEIKILTKSDGRKVGCCFVQFETRNSAEKAMEQANLKKFMNRTIVLDWAIAKDKFLETMKKEKVTENIEIKEENDTKEKIIEYNEENVSIKEEKVSDAEQSETEIKNDMEDDETEDDEIEDDEISNISLQKEVERKRCSNDVEEQRTVFFKNVPFRATNTDLKNCMEQFGPVLYALICVDKLTEHSKGTAFVKFKSCEDAKRCLEAGTELQIFGQTLDSYPALSKQSISDKSNEKKTKSKDSRNLYLVREGVIVAGSPAAHNVSAADMAKRLKIEQWKTQILKNLNMFVSKLRLIVHNLPPSITDTELRNIIRKHAPRDAVIIEARVMKNKDLKTSKEYGFVGFTKHEDALKTLRVINNNPNIFSIHKRPIVSFSIENLQIIKRKRNRLEKSKKNNPLSSEYVPLKDTENSNPTNIKRRKIIKQKVYKK